ncbi:ATPase [Desulfovibrio sp. 3_1_syn3]|uniref:ATPase n=1 Tax=Desulfovibrio sp. 3_1_syn3 TaxID=457398 RepID=UPI001E2F5668|nr:ATPase [Desulfovibrio sp. 3_1_syn3]
MSSVESTPHYSQSSPTPPTLLDFAALATSLQEIAQSLLVCAPQGPTNSTAMPSASREDGETRSFYFPQSAIHMERELLRKYRATDFQGLLEEVYTLLVGLVKLMQSVHKDVRVRGYVISSLGAQLDHAAALVLRMRHIYERVVPVQG